jgi:hypothetical protein
MFWKRFATVSPRGRKSRPPPPNMFRLFRTRPFQSIFEKQLSFDYADYLELLKGKEPIRLLRKFFIASKVRKSIQFYTSCYIPYEILWWGGEIAEMFPRSCALLERRGLGLDRFVKFWFDEPWPEGNTDFDFFLLKIRRFVEFMESVDPEGSVGAIQEAEILREGYAMSCREIEFSSIMKEGASREVQAETTTG